MRHRTPCGEISFGGILTARAPETDPRHHREIKRDNNQIQCTHGIHASVFPPSSELRFQNSPHTSKCRLRSIAEPAHQPQARKSFASSHARPVWCSSWIQLSVCHSARIASKRCAGFSNRVTSSKAFCHPATKTFPRRSYGRLHSQPRAVSRRCHKSPFLSLQGDSGHPDRSARSIATELSRSEIFQRTVLCCRRCFQA